MSGRRDVHRIRWRNATHVPRHHGLEHTKRQVAIVVGVLEAFDEIAIKTKQDTHLDERARLVSSRLTDLTARVGREGGHSSFFVVSHFRNFSTR